VKRNKAATCETCGVEFMALDISAGKYCSTKCAHPENPATEMMATDVELAWVAGILEGEGTFRVTDAGSTQVTAEMADLDVLQKIQRVLGFGTIGNERKRGENRRTTWTFCVSGRRDIEQLLNAILPYMGERRTKQIATVLGYIRVMRKMRKQDAS